MKECVSAFKRFRQPLLYLSIGGLSAGIDLGLLILMREVLGIDVVIAASISYVASMLANFTANKVITFEAGLRDKYSNQLIRYLLLAALNYAVTVTFIWYLSSVLGASYILVKAIILVLLAIANFFLYKKFIYV